MNGTSIIFPFAAETQQASLLHGQMNGTADGAFAESLAAALSGQAVPAQPNSQQAAASRAALGITTATGGQAQDAGGLSGNAAAASAQDRLDHLNGLPVPGQSALEGVSGLLGAEGQSELGVRSGTALAGEVGAAGSTAAKADPSSPVASQARPIGPEFGVSAEQARTLSSAAPHQAVLDRLAGSKQISRSALTSSQSLVVDPAIARQAEALSEAGTRAAGQPSSAPKAEGALLATATSLGRSQQLATTDPTIQSTARDGLGQAPTAPVPSSTEGQGLVAEAEALARSAPGLLPSIASAGQARPSIQAQPSKSPSTQNDAGASQLSTTQRVGPTGGAQVFGGDASHGDVDADTANQLANASAALRNWKDASGDERQATAGSTPADGLPANRSQDASPADDRLNGAQTTADDQNGGPKSAPTISGAQTTPLAVGAGQQGGAGQSDYQATTIGVDAAAGLNEPFEQRFDVAVDRLRASNSPPPSSAQVALQITRSIPQGIDRFSLQLQPADLGVVEIQLDIERNGQVSATITAERPETLELLQRDGRILERSLSDNGLKLSNDGLNFALKQDQHQQHQQQGQGFNQRSEQSQASFAGTSYGDNASDEGALPSYHRIDSRRLLDIRT